MWGQLAAFSLWVAARGEERRQARLDRRFDRRLDEIEGPHVFVSYSRSETPLVEDLVHDLREIGNEDLRRLPEPPALCSPWDEQLEVAIEQSSVVVLIVSDRSIDLSRQTLVSNGKRALGWTSESFSVIVEPVVLPPVLSEGREWIDLRSGSFRQRARTGPPGSESCTTHSPATDAWFEATADHLARILLAAMAIVSIPLFWTIASLVVLVALPFRIRRRNFTYQTARAALVGQCRAGAVLGD